MSLITLRAITKYVSRPKSTAVKDIDDISGQKEIPILYLYRQRRYRPISVIINHVNSE